MEIYLYLILFSIYCYIINITINNEKIERLILFLFFVILFVVSAFRNHVGTDYGVYLSIYKNIENRIYDPEGVEIGYFYLNQLTNWIFGGEYTIFLVTSLIIIGLIYITIKRFSVNPILSAILFMCLFYITGFNIIRQYIALAIIFYSLRYCQSKTKWIIPVLIASLFHITAIFIIPFYLLAKLNFNKKQYLFILGLGFLLFLGYEKTVIYLTNLIDNFEHYNGTNFVTEGANPMRTFINICILIFCTISYKKIMKDRKMQFSFTMIVFGTIFSLFMIKGKIFARVVDYFMIYQIILIPYVIINMEKYNLKRYKLIITTFIMLASYGFFYYSVKTGQSGSTPYRTYISDLDIQKNFLSWFYNIE